MIKNVLLVDDDREMLIALKEGFQRYKDSFATMLASDGLKAVKILKANTVSLVVTDLKMPGMDGFELLAHVMAHYPDVPVLIITGYSTPEMERLAREGGAVGYVAKPFLIEDLARRIITVLRKESEGGTLHNVSSGIFLQLVSIEQKTCTIRLEDKRSSQNGVLFFLEGELLDARVNDLQGEDAAYEIFSWDQVNLSIQNGCALKEKRIRSDMQRLVIEATRCKDENAVDTAHPAVMEEVEPFEPETVDAIMTLKEKIEATLGPSSGIEDIYRDNSWNQLVGQISRIGVILNLGELEVGYVDRGDDNDFIVMPGEDTTVIAVNPKCPREKLLRVLSESTFM